MLSRFFIC